MQPALNPSRLKADETTRLESLARETDTSVNLVRTIFTEELQALEQEAKVRTFLAVIAMRRTRLILKSLESNNAADIH